MTHYSLDYMDVDRSLIDRSSFIPLNRERRRIRLKRAALLSPNFRIYAVTNQLTACPEEKGNIMPEMNMQEIKVWYERLLLWMIRYPASALKHRKDASPLLSHSLSVSESSEGRRRRENMLLLLHARSRTPEVNLFWRYGATCVHIQVP